MTMPFVECLSRGECRNSDPGLSFWLTTINPSQQFSAPQSATLKDSFRSRVSRCRVCSRQGF